MKELKQHVRKPATICHTPKAQCYLLVSAPAKSAPCMSLPACLDFTCHATPPQCFYRCGHRMPQHLLVSPAGRAWNLILSKV